MRFLKIAGAAALLSLAGCSSHVVVAKSPPHPAPPHSVRGPVASLGIPPGHYPPPGHCRIWVPGRPPGHQARSAPCYSLGPVPLGAWVLHRPVDDKRIIEVSVYDDVRPETVVSVGYYDVKNGRQLRGNKFK